MHWRQRKKPHLFIKYGCPQNQKNTFKNNHFWPFWSKHYHFWRLFLFFFRNHTFSRAGVFCVAFSASGGFFWAIKNSFLTIFPIFHHKGGPLWFRTSKKLTTPLKMAENWKQKYFCEQNYKWIKNPDGTVRLKGWIKIRISLSAHRLRRLKFSSPGQVWRHLQSPRSYCCSHDVCTMLLKVIVLASEILTQNVIH